MIFNGAKTHTFMHVIFRATYWTDTCSLLPFFFELEPKFQPSTLGVHTDTVHCYIKKRNKEDDL
jgi:hypothetical protein